MDSVFGKMIYRHKWYREQKEIIFGKEYTIKIAAKAYLGKPITDEQRAAYCQYTKKREEYLKIAAEQLIEYVNSNFDELAYNWQGARKIKKETELPAVVTPKTLLFKQDGTTLLLLECDWDIDNGVAVKLSPEVAVGGQDLFL
jgi:hypothetical protein